MSDGLVAEATTWGEALEVALGAKGSPILLEETAASQSCGTTAAKKVLGVPGSAQSRNHLRSRMEVSVSPSGSTFGRCWVS